MNKTAYCLQCLFCCCKSTYVGRSNNVVFIEINSSLLGCDKSSEDVKRQCGNDKFRMMHEFSNNKVNTKIEINAGWFWLFPENFAELFVYLQKMNIKIGFYTHDMHDRVDFIKRLNAKMSSLNPQFKPLDIQETMFISLDFILNSDSGNSMKLKFNLPGLDSDIFEDTSFQIGVIPNKLAIVYKLFENNDLQLLGLMDKNSERFLESINNMSIQLASNKVVLASSIEKQIENGKNIDDFFNTFINSISLKILNESSSLTGGFKIQQYRSLDSDFGNGNFK